MYAKHFELRVEPFALTPDPSFLYLSPGHAEALAALKIGLQSRRGLLMMTGEVGTGKTTLLYSLLNELGDGIHTAYVSSPHLTFDQILARALHDFGVECESENRGARLAALNEFLLRCAEDGTTAALIVDEAQNLDDETFENLRLLSNVETFKSKLLQIVLVGQPELADALARPAVRQIAERVAVQCYVNPLSWNESQRYIAHRLELAGGSPALFSASARRLIVRAARGLPRRLNILCHNALLFAFGRGESRVTRTVARAAVEEREGSGLVRLTPSSTPTTPHRSLPLLGLPLRVPSLIGTVAVLAVAGVVTASWWSNSTQPTGATMAAAPIGAPALASPEPSSDLLLDLSYPHTRERSVLEVERAYRSLRENAS